MRTNLCVHETVAQVVHRIVLKYQIKEVDLHRECHFVNVLKLSVKRVSAIT